MYSHSISEHTLDNDLKVFLINDPSASLVSVKVFVKTGSINEDPLLGSGISHYLEHMVAGGSTTVNSEQKYKKMLSHLGGAYNAYTTIDHTSYYINTIPKYLNQAITILNEWMFYCKFAKKEFDRERKVIIKEIEKNNANIKRAFAELCQRNFYKFHPIHFPIIGYLENFKKLTIEDLKAYYQEHYVPSNMILVIGGPIQEKTTLQLVQETFGKIPTYAKPPTVLYKEPKPFSSRTVLKEGPTAVTQFSMRFSTVDLYSENLYALDLLEYILAHGEDSIFYNILVEKEKLAYAVHCTSYTPTTTNGYFEIHLEIDYKNKQKVIKRIKNIIQDIKNGKLDSKLIERARKQKISEDIFSVTTIEDKVARLGQSYLYAHTNDFFDKYIANFKTITKKDIIRVTQQFLDFDRTVYTILKPISTVKNQTSPPQPPTTIKPKKIVLNNGLKILLYHDSSLPKVYAKIFVLGGLRVEIPEKNGLGNIFAHLLGKCSHRYNKETIKRTIEDHGANLGCSLGNNTLFHNLSCLADDFEKLSPLLFDTFLKPKFLADDLQEIKRKTNKWIEQRNDSWYSQGIYLFKKSFFKNHPYGLSPLGEKVTIENITPQDLYQYHQKLINPQNICLSIFGDFDEQNILKQINKTFANLTPPPVSFNIQTKIKRILHTQTLSKKIKSKHPVCAIFIGYDSTTFNDTKNNLKLDLLDATLSGMNYPGGRLHNILREKGLVYLVHGINQLGLEDGFFLIYALTSPENSEKVQKIIFDEIAKLKQTIVSDEEFSQALAQLEYHYKNRVSALESLAVISSSDELYKRGFDYYLTMQKSLGQLQKTDIKATAQKYLNHPQIYILSNE